MQSNCKDPYLQVRGITVDLILKVEDNDMVIMIMQLRDGVL